MVYFLLIVTTLVSGSVFFLIKGDFQRPLKYLLAFSGAFLMGITFLSLVPEVYGKATAYTGIFVLAGFLLQLLLELITEGAEHGHRHQHHEGETVSPFLLLTGLCIHAFLEGMPITGHPVSHMEHTLVYGIIVHNIPIALTLTGLFLHYGCSKYKTLVYLAVFAFMTPLGSLVNQVIDRQMILSMDQYINYILAMVIGIFLHVSTSILFETEENHQYNRYKFLTVFAGLAIAFLISIQH